MKWKGGGELNSSGTVYSEPIQVAGRLDSLGIREEALRQAVLWGLGHFFDCTAFDPPYLPGMLSTGKIVRRLREILVPQGWSWSNPRNYALTTHPGKEYSIAVAGGNENTGQEATPTTRTEKGTATRDAIALNIQRALADIDPAFPRPDTAPAAMETWLLLHHVHYESEGSGEIRLELSLPAGMDDDGYVSLWRERIILAPSRFGPDNVRINGNSSPDAGSGGGPVNVPVTRRKR